MDLFVKEKRHLILIFLRFLFMSFITFLLSNNHLKGQENINSNSLINVLTQAKEDTLKVKILLSLGDHFQKFVPDTASKYFMKAYALSRQINSEKYEARSLLSLGLNKKDRGKYDEAKNLFIKSLEIFLKIDDKGGLAQAYNYLGLAYWKKGFFKEAINNQLKSLEICEKMQNRSGEARAYSHIGIIYHDQEDFEKTLEYYHKSLEIRENIEDRVGMGQCYNNIGLIHQDLGENEKALLFYLKSLKIKEEQNNKQGATITEINIGSIYTELGNYGDSELHYQKGLKLAKEIKNVELESILQIYRASSYITQGRYEGSIKYGLKGLNGVKKINSLFYQKQALENLAIASDSLGNFKDAYRYFKEYKLLNDSIFNESNSKQMIEMQTKYDTEKKERENDLLKKNNELQRLKINQETNFRNFLIAITVLILLMAGMLYNKVQSKKRNEIILENKVKSRTKELENAKNKAEENDRLKSAFLANISHEIRTPMNGIMGFAELLKNPQLSGKKQTDYIDKIEKSGERMLNIINNLVEISKIESGQMDLSIDHVEVDEEIKKLFHSYQEEARERGVELSYSLPKTMKNIIINTDRGKFNTILGNLLNNALKFTLDGEVCFGYEVKKGLLEFFVQDTGIGIADNMKDVIFERFIQADLAAEKQYDGAGLGLSISKAFVEMLGGEIKVESEFWKGAKFLFTIPIGDHALVDLEDKVNSAC